MGKTKFSLNDSAFATLVATTDQKTLMVWALECVRRVLPYFVEQFPQDPRVLQALQVGEQWLETGVCKMVVIRGASLGAHAAAREVGENSPARSVARTAGQAVATAHVPTHALGAANYAQQAVYRGSVPEQVHADVAKESAWQLQRLIELRQLAGKDPA